jgi:hypothetical protein
MPVSVALLITLRIAHILSGVLWVGAAVLTDVFLGPAIRNSGPAGNEVMRQLVQVRRMPVYMTVNMALSVLSGAGLMVALSAASGASWLHSPFGRTLSVGALAAVLGAVVGVFGTKPAAQRLAALGAEIQTAGGSPSSAHLAELESVRLRLGRTTRWVTTLLIAAAAAMACARYV